MWCYVFPARNRWLSCPYSFALIRKSVFWWSTLDLAFPSFWGHRFWSRGDPDECSTNQMATLMDQCSISTWLWASPTALHAKAYWERHIFFSESFANLKQGVSFIPGFAWSIFNSLRQCQVYHVISRSSGNPCLREDAGRVVGQILWEAPSKNPLNIKPHTFNIAIYSNNKPSP